MLFHYFLDETGDHGLGFIDPNFPLFLLCGCLFREDHLKETQAAINAFKLKHFKSIDVILHSREIRKCEGAFQTLFDLKVKEAFYNDLNKIISSSKYKIIGSGIDKKKLIETYGRHAHNPYIISLSFVLERMIYCLNKMDRSSQVHIALESRGKQEDAQLDAGLKSILDRGTSFVSREELRRKIIGFKFRKKKDNDVGLQIADLSAYPLARYILNPKEPYIPFNFIEDKIDCKKKGQYLGWGLKIFP